MNAPRPTSTRLKYAAGILAGVLLGLGMFTMHYGDGAAYLSKDPAACANCHVMEGHYSSWQASSHAHVAKCNDCHLEPHPVGKWITKADNGLFHSLAFTTGDFPDPIRIKARNSRRTQQACLKCHHDIAENLLPATADDQALQCVHCHQAVGHATR